LHVASESKSTEKRTRNIVSNHPRMKNHRRKWEKKSKGHRKTSTKDLFFLILTLMDRAIDRKRGGKRKGKVHGEGFKAYR